MANATNEAPLAAEVEVYRHPTWQTADAMWVKDAYWLTHRTECMAYVQEYYRPTSSTGLLAADEEPQSPPNNDTRAVWRRRSGMQSCAAAAPTAA